MSLTDAIMRTLGIIPRVTHYKVTPRDTGPEDLVLNAFREADALNANASQKLNSTAIDEADHTLQVHNTVVDVLDRITQSKADRVMGAAESALELISRGRVR